jgi:hypothetical protein
MSKNDTGGGRVLIKNNHIKIKIVSEDTEDLMWT